MGAAAAVVPAQGLDWKMLRDWGKLPVCRLAAAADGGRGMVGRLATGLDCSTGTGARWGWLGSWG